MFVSFVIVCALGLWGSSVESTALVTQATRMGIFTNILDSGTYGGENENIGPYSDIFRRRCPLCDSSVYSYCSDKLFHDSCCCNYPSSYDPLPYQCKFADCSFLHANSCREHKLITACCCTTV